MHRVGIIPFERRSSGIYLLCVTSLTRGRWVFPKGSMKEGESHIEACAREGFEEAGVSGIAFEDFPMTVIISKAADDELVETPVTYYPFLVTQLADEWDEMDKRERRWTSIHSISDLFESDHRILIDQFDTLLPWVLTEADNLVGIDR